MKALLAAACLMVACNVSALTSSDLLTYCNNKPTAESMLDYSVCATYIRGAIEMAEILHTTAGMKGHEQQFCLPTGKVDVQSDVDFWLAYIRRHPNEINLPAAFTVFFAISSEYPCE